MTVVGQTQVVYTYDNANRLTQVQQGTSTVTLAYDDADRRTSLTLPNTNSIVYAYDAASQLTTLTPILRRLSSTARIGRCYISN